MRGLFQRISSRQSKFSGGGGKKNRVFFEVITLTVVVLETYRKEVNGGGRRGVIWSLNNVFSSENQFFTPSRVHQSDLKSENDSKIDAFF